MFATNTPSLKLESFVVILSMLYPRSRYPVAVS